MALVYVYVGMALFLARDATLWGVREYKGLEDIELELSILTALSILFVIGGPIILVDKFWITLYDTMVDDRLWWRSLYVNNL